MTAFSDRVLGPLRSIIRGATARTDFFVLYSAVVNSDNGDETCDLTPEDSRLPSMSKIPKMYGLPGITSTISSGTKVLLCFQNGDPSKPVIVLFGTGTPTKVTLAPSAELDLVGNSDAVALASKVNARLSNIESALLTWTPVPNDGGSALKAAATTAIGTPASTASTKVKAS